MNIQYSVHTSGTDCTSSSCLQAIQGRRGSVDIYMHTLCPSKNPQVQSILQICCRLMKPASADLDHSRLYRGTHYLRIFYRLVQKKHRKETAGSVTTIALSSKTVYFISTLPSQFFSELVSYSCTIYWASNVALIPQLAPLMARACSLP